MNLVITTLKAMFSVSNLYLNKEVFLRVSAFAVLTAMKNNIVLNGNILQKQQECHQFRVLFAGASASAIHRITKFNSRLKMTKETFN